MSKWIMIYDKCYQELIWEIKNIRVEKYTQKEFSKELGVTQKTVSHYENCRSEINLKLLIKICKILDINFIKMMKKFLKQNDNENKDKLINLLKSKPNLTFYEEEQPFSLSKYGIQAQAPAKEQK